MLIVCHYDYTVAVRRGWYTDCYCPANDGKQLYCFWYVQGVTLVTLVFIREQTPFYLA